MDPITGVCWATSERVTSRRIWKKSNSSFSGRQKVKIIMIFLWWWLSDGSDGDCLAMVKILLVILMRPKLKPVLYSSIVGDIDET